jgi:hypothetical protein
VGVLAQANAQVRMQTSGGSGHLITSQRNSGPLSASNWPRTAQTRHIHAKLDRY